MSNATIPAPERLTQAILTVRQRYLDEGLAPDLRTINSGLCDDFVSDVYQQLGGIHRAYELGLGEMGIAELLVEDENDILWGRPFDRKLLSEQFPDFAPTHGLDWDALDDLSAAAGFDPGTHVWIVFEGRHYDAECPEGVANPLELPFFDRVITSWMDEARFGPSPG